MSTPISDEDRAFILETMRKVEQLDGRAAPRPRAGVCIVCSGKVTETFEMTSDTPSQFIPLGPGSRDYYHWTSSGLSCEGCGIAYAKLPVTPAIQPQRETKP